MYDDPNGKFPWLIVGIVVCAAAIGGVLGYTSDQKLGATLPQGAPNPDRKWKHPNDITEEDLLPADDAPKQELTTGDRIGNTVLGTLLGAAVGGLIVSGIGAASTVVAGTGAILIPAFGTTGAQTFAIGALVYDAIAMIFGPIMGVEMEPIEVEP